MNMYAIIDEHVHVHVQYVHVCKLNLVMITVNSFHTCISFRYFMVSRTMLVKRTGAHLPGSSLLPSAIS